jgi:hypothetical protein
VQLHAFCHNTAELNRSLFSRSSSQKLVLMLLSHMQNSFAPALLLDMPAAAS